MPASEVAQKEKSSHQPVHPTRRQVSRVAPRPAGGAPRARRDLSFVPAKGGLRQRHAEARPVQIFYNPESVGPCLTCSSNLERQAHLDPAAEAKLIIHRLRIGTINVENIRLAVHLGHLPACLALGQPVADSAWASPEPTMEELWTAIHELEPFGRAVLVRAALAAAELTVPWCEREVGRHDPLLEKLREAARRWLDHPTDEHARQAALLTARPLPHPYRGPAFASRFAACAAHEPLEHATRSAAVAVHLAVQAIGGVVEVRDVLRSTLIDGALG